MGKHLTFLNTEGFSFLGITVYPGDSIVLNTGAEILIGERNGQGHGIVIAVPEQVTVQRIRYADKLRKSSEKEKLSDDDHES